MNYTKYFISIYMIICLLYFSLIIIINYFLKILASLQFLDSKRSLHLSAALAFTNTSWDILWLAFGKQWPCDCIKVIFPTVQSWTCGFFHSSTIILVFLVILRNHVTGMRHDWIGKQWPSDYIKVIFPTVQGWTCGFFHSSPIILAFLVILRVRLDRTYFAETENWKHCRKIIFKCVNSTMGPIFNEKVTEKWDLWVPCTVHKTHWCAEKGWKVKLCGYCSWKVAALSP